MRALPARSPRIRHRSELTEKAWENAVQGQGKVFPRCFWSHSNASLCRLNIYQDVVYQDNKLSSRECVPSIVVKKELFKKREKEKSGNLLWISGKQNEKKCTQNQVENTKKIVWEGNRAWARNNQEVRRTRIPLKTIRLKQINRNKKKRGNQREKQQGKMKNKKTRVKWIKANIGSITSRCSGARIKAEVRTRETTEIELTDACKIKIVLKRTEKKCKRTIAIKQTWRKLEKKKEQTRTKRKRKQFVHCGNPTLFSTIEFLSLVLFKVVLYVILFVVSL